MAPAPANRRNKQAEGSRWLADADMSDNRMHTDAELVPNLGDRLHKAMVGIPSEHPGQVVFALPGTTQRPFKLRMMPSSAGFSG